MADALLAGFTEPVADAQRAFRAVLDAIAHPGRIVAIAGPAEAPTPVFRATAAIGLTLFDFETPLWLDAASDVPAVREWLKFHTGAPMTAAPGDASFALISRPEDMPPLASFALGSDAYPDRSATVVLQVRGFERGQALALSGPGIDGGATLRVDGLPRSFVAQWRENHARFPLGVDVMLAAGDRLAAVPRSTRIEG